MRRRAKSTNGVEFSSPANSALIAGKERDRRYSGKTRSASSASSLNSASSEEGLADENVGEVFDRTLDSPSSFTLEMARREDSDENRKPRSPEPFHPSDALLEIEVGNGNCVSCRPSRHLSSLLPRSSSLPPNNCINDNREK